jgi:hypothetical protein
MVVIEDDNSFGVFRDDGPAPSTKPQIANKLSLAKSKGKAIAKSTGTI